MKSILFVCGNPPHLVHEKFAKSIDADFFYYNEPSLRERILNIWKIPRNYDIYFSEGLFSYIVLAKMLGCFKKNTKIINLFADPRLYQMISEKKFDFKSLKVKKYPFFKRIFAKFLIKKLDGALCISKFEEDLLKTINKKIPSEIVYAFIGRKEFFRFNSKLKENNILFVGGGPDYYYKGLDFLIEIFLEVKKQSGTSKLFIVGGGWEKFKEKYAKEKSIIFLGKKNLKEIKKYMNECSIYCHFGRGDSFPVSTLEAMATGIPCIVSDITGTKEVVEKVSKDFVVSLNKKEKIIELISKYFKKPKKEKSILGKKFKKEARFFNEKNCINLFKERFSKLIKQI